MIKDPELIKEINNKNILVERLGLEITRRCNYKCRHCYVGEAQDLDIDARVLEIVLDYFKTIGQIDLFGGEVLLGTRGLKALDDALGNARPRPKIGGISLISNGAVVNEESLDVLESIYKKLDLNFDGHRGGVVSIEFSNDFWHKEQEEIHGVKRDENIAKIKKLHPRFNYTDRNFAEKKRYLYGELSLFKSGRAVDLKVFNFKDKKINMNFRSLAQSQISSVRQIIAYLNGTDEYAGHKEDFSLDEFVVGATGKVRNCLVDYETAEHRNYGDVLTTPIPKILIENGCRMPF